MPIRARGHGHHRPKTGSAARYDRYPEKCLLITAYSGPWAETSGRLRRAPGCPGRGGRIAAGPAGLREQQPEGPGSRFPLHCAGPDRGRPGHRRNRADKNPAGWPSHGDGGAGRAAPGRGHLWLGPTAGKSWIPRTALWLSASGWQVGPGQRVRRAGVPVVGRYRPRGTPVRLTQPDVKLPAHTGYVIAGPGGAAGRDIAAVGSRRGQYGRH